MTTPALAARHAGQAAVQAADVAVHRNHGTYIKAALSTLVERGAPFHADHVRELAQTIAAIDEHDFTPADNLIPSYIGSWAAHGRIVATGQRVTSRRKSRHASRNNVYVANPNPPSPPM